MLSTDANVRKEQHPTDAHGKISISNLSVVYGDEEHALLAVDDFSLQIEPNEFVTIIGPSGCGKSTVLNIIAGFVEASSGTVRVDGKRVTKPGAERGMVFQQFVLFPWMSVQANVEFGLKMRNIPKKQRHEIAKDYIRLVGLDGFENMYPKELSGGMQQRVGIARILASNPHVMLMDEPFGALDAQTRYLMQQLLLKVWDEFRTTIVFVTHDVDEALLLSDRICVMTSRPGSVQQLMKNELPRPRKPEVVASERYAKYKLQILDLLKDEITPDF